MTFVKGKSGNPAGRPKLALDIKEYTRQFTQEAIDVLVDLMRNARDERVRKTAADSLLDRGIGKPMQEVELSGKDGAPLIPILNVTVTGVTEQK